MITKWNPVAKEQVNLQIRERHLEMVDNPVYLEVTLYR